MSELERDPRIDTAWRDASREEPSVALDASIQAAARRAVEAGPQRRRNKHWWYPLAAAATVAVIAVGLLQMTPPGQVTPSTIVANSAPAKPQVSTAPPASALKKDMASEGAPAPAVGQSNEPAQRRLDASDERKSEPFPAAPPRAAAERRDAAPAEAQNAIREQKPADEPMSAAVPSPARVGSAKLAGAVAAAESPAAEKRQRSEVAPAKEADVAQPKQKSARSVEDWIKLIRDLRAEGRTDEAAKELAAFRSAYGERADALLPQDLRRPSAASAAAGAK